MVFSKTLLLSPQNTADMFLGVCKKRNTILSFTKKICPPSVLASGQLYCQVLMENNESNVKGRHQSSLIAMKMEIWTRPHEDLLNYELEDTVQDYLLLCFVTATATAITAAMMRMIRTKGRQSNVQA